MFLLYHQELFPSGGSSIRVAVLQWSNHQEPLFLLVVVPSEPLFWWVAIRSRCSFVVIRSRCSF